MIYFIQGDRGGPIKIGCAGNPWQRLATLQTGNPTKLAVVAVIPGDRAEEAALHIRFAASRGQGEWFAPTPDLLGFIDGIRAAQRDAPPKPMAVDEDMLVGMSREQVDALAIALDTRDMCRKARALVIKWFYVSPLADEIVADARFLRGSLATISRCLETAASDPSRYDAHLLSSAAFFDGVDGYPRDHLVKCLSEMLLRHESATDCRDGEVGSTAESAHVEATDLSVN